MAPTTHLFLSATILSAAAASGATWRVPGLALPHNPLDIDRCRWYVSVQAYGVGPFLPMPEMKVQCCRQLEDIAEYCRCEAVRILMHGMIPPGDKFEGHLLQDLPGCPRKVQRAFAPTLVTEVECNRSTHHGGPYCPSLGRGEKTVPSN